MSDSGVTKPVSHCLRGDVGESVKLELREHIWLLELTPDYETQQIAIQSQLQRHRQAAAATVNAVKVIEQHAQNAKEAVLNEWAVDAWIDQLHHSVFEDAAHSMSAVGLLAPFLESLFDQCFRQIGVKFPAATGDGSHLRWQLPSGKRWDCHFYREGAETKKGIAGGIVQLCAALNLTSSMPSDFGKIVAALFAYRNKMFHCGFEWPKDEREEFWQAISDQEWPSTWFNRAMRGDETWIVYVTEEFVSRVLQLIDEVIIGFATLVRDRWLPARLASGELSPDAPEG